MSLPLDVSNESIGEEKDITYTNDLGKNSVSTPTASKRDSHVKDLIKKDVINRSVLRLMKNYFKSIM